MKSKSGPSGLTKKIYVNNKTLMSPIIENLFENITIEQCNPEPYKTRSVSLPKSFFSSRPKPRVSLSEFARCFPSAAEHDAAKLLSVVTSNAKDVSPKTANAAI